MDKKIKVAFIHNIISPYRVPLFEKLASNPKMDLDVYFCSKTHKERKWKILDSNKYNYEILKGVTVSCLNINYRINPTIILKLIRGKYDVVIICGNKDFTTQAAFIAAKITGIKVILWSEGIESARSLLGKVIEPITKYVVKKAEAIVVPGVMSKNFHVNLGAEPQKIFIAWDSIDNEKYFKKSPNFIKNKKPLKKALGLQNKKIILYVGQLIERKGLLYLIEAYQKLRGVRNDICLVVVGSGSMKDKLENICKDRGLKDVHFMGWVSEEEKIKYYYISDLFVLPTLKDVWGLVANEAMACGLPIIATKAAGCSADMIISGENGFIVEEANTEQLYLAMKKILSNEKLAKRMGRKSLEMIKNKFTIESMADSFANAIKFSMQKKMDYD